MLQENNIQTLEYDYIIIGSGFGGSVSAWRLTQKGYKVLILEAGKRYQSKDFPKTNWNLKKFLWAPFFKCFGIFKLSFFKHIWIASGHGVGGGSLVYANTLLVPPNNVWDDPQWKNLINWKNDLQPHYITAQKMLGVTQNKYLGHADHILKNSAAAFSEDVNKTFYHTNVGVYFREANKTVSDPYFDGDGPERTGCNYCGGCMTGCRYNSKNTLDKNYLFLAEKYGAKIKSEQTVIDLQTIDNDPHGQKGYFVYSKKTSSYSEKPTFTYKTKGVIFSAGVLGTLKLLFQCRQKGSLKNLSPFLGHNVRTNSESIIGVRLPKTDQKLTMSNGCAIGSGIYINKETHIESVRYSKGSIALSFLCTPLPEKLAFKNRFLSWVWDICKNPLKYLKVCIPMRWACESLILLTMQSADNKLQFSYQPTGLFKKRWKLITHLYPNQTAPSSSIPEAARFAHFIAKKYNGIAMTALGEVLFDTSMTAHILGGAAIGESSANGVVNYKSEVFNYQNLYVCDGSMIGANLGVNPSLTITALTEHAMSHIPKKSKV